ncbi:Putative esterase [Corynebacterium faecale]|uniref:PaaI family thioesterase n=1 Tax=Corynebacterium faecale TaxID=1758466 RepID=UPI0025B3C886|nr:PaaI family thioesterase [Corynebacterium faecale]WJY92231.1 Putative esterase [Corynebacterium faecale]
MTQNELKDVLALATIAVERPLTSDELEMLNTGNFGLDRTLGLRYVEVGPERVISELRVTAKHLQPAGLVNGGVYCAIAESTASTAGIIFGRGKPVVGVNNNTDFISSVRDGVIRAEATAIQKGGRTQVWQVLCTHNGELVARTTLRTMVLG